MLMNKQTKTGGRLLVVDPKKCISCGACVSIAPKSFTLDESKFDAVSVAINPPGDNEADVQQAIEACPTRAISLKLVT